MQGHTYAEGEVLGGEDADEALVVVYDEHAVGALGGAQLAGIGDADVLRDSQSGRGTEGSDGSWLRGGATGTAHAAALDGGRIGSGALAALTLQLELDLLADGLGAVGGGGSVVRGPWSVVHAGGRGIQAHLVLFVDAAAGVAGVHGGHGCSARAERGGGGGGCGGGGGAQAAAGRRQAGRTRPAAWRAWHRAATDPSHTAPVPPQTSHVTCAV